MKTLRAVEALGAGVLARVFFRSFFLQASWNPQGMQNLGLAYALYPALKKLYPEPEAQSAAVRRHLAFFNTLSGGSRNGPRYLVDSNIDWGQDLLKLRDYLHGARAPCVALEYFGAADLPYYGMDLPKLKPMLAGGARCLGAVSATALRMDPQLAPLRRCEPLARVGYSIYVYDLHTPACPLSPPAKP